MKYKITLIAALLATMFACAQTLQIQPSLENQLNGNWLEENNTSYKWRFNSTTLKAYEYENNILISEYDYEVEWNSCNGNFAQGVSYLKLIDTEDNSIICFEINHLSDVYLTLMIIDKAKPIRFEKQ